MYCGQCRARHSSRKSKPSCDTTGDTKCEVIQSEPYQLDKDNWMPILIFEKALIFSPTVQTEGYDKDGRHTIYNHKVLSLEAVKFVLDAYLEDDEIEDMEYLLDALAVLKGVQEGVIRDKMRS